MSETTRRRVPHWSLWVVALGALIFIASMATPDRWHGFVLGLPLIVIGETLWLTLGRRR